MVTREANKLKKIIKRAISLVLVLCILCGPAMAGIAAAASSTAYKAWKQYDNRWANVVVNYSPEMNRDRTMKEIGCTITAVAMAAVHSGAVPNDFEQFNPLVFLRFLQNNAGLSHCNLEWNKASEYTPSFKFCGKINDNAFLAKTESERIAVMKEKIDSGYVLIARVKPNSSHFVAIDYIQGNTVYMMDPNSDSTVLYDKYTSVVGIWYFRGVHNGTANRVVPQIGNYFVTASTLNVRSGPGISNSIISSISNATVVNVKEISGNWGKVTVNGVAGWISLDYARRISDDARSPVNMSVSESGFDFIKNEEGYRQYAYWDNAQYSIGYGSHTTATEYPNGITKEQADALLRAQILDYEDKLKSYLVKYNVMVTQPQYDALVSFAYNLGSNCWTRYQLIGSLVKVGGAGYTESEIRNVFGRYIYADGEIEPGLVSRRAREAELFITGMNGQTVQSNQAPEIVSPAMGTDHYPAGESVNFGWNAVPGASYYEVSVKRLSGLPRNDTGETEDGVNIAGFFRYVTNSLSVTVPGSDLTGDYWYKFAVGAVSPGGTAKWSSTYLYIKSASLSAIQIASPNNPESFAAGTDVSITWGRVQNADYYTYVLKELYGAPDIGNDNEKGEVLENKRVNTNDTVVFNSEWFKTGVWYKFAVGACNDDGRGSPWDEVYFYVRDNEVEPTDIAISKNEATVEVDSFVKLSATVYPEHLSDAQVNWSSSSQAVAMVSSTGRVKGVGVGTATITAETENGISASCSVKVISSNDYCYTVTYDANGGTVSPQSETVEEDESVILPTAYKTVIIDFDTDGGSPQYDSMPLQSIFGGWKKNGTGTKYEAGSSYTPKSDCTLVAYWQPGATITLPPAPTKAGYKFLHWVVATHENPLPAQPGQAVGAREDLTYKAVWEKVDSVIPVSSVTCTPNAVTLGVGDTQRLTAAVLPSDATNRSITWASSNSGVASVSSDGLVTAVSAGTARISVSNDDGSATAYCNVTVTAVAEKYGVFISQREVAVMAAAPDDDDLLGENYDLLTIRSEPTNVSISITVESSGYAMVGYSRLRTEEFYRTSVTGMHEGETYLVATMTYNGQTYTDRCKITVTPYIETPAPIESYCLYFNASGGYNAPAPMSGATEYIIPYTVPVRDGYTFLGWTSSAGASAASYSVGHSIALTDDITLYAVWQKNPDGGTQQGAVPVSCRLVAVPLKTDYSYKIDSQADLTGIIVEVTYSDGEKQNISDRNAFKVVDFDTQSVGSKAVTVEYEGITLQYNIRVSYTWWQWIINIFLLGIIWY